MKKSASCTRFGGALLSISALLLAMCLVFALLLASAPQPGSESKSHQAVLTVTPQPIHQALGYRFSDKDITAYEKVFELQENGHWKAADDLVSTIKDQTLMGDVLAQRYLHKKYQSSYTELSQWLKHYSDMPVAPHVQALAQQKKPADATLPAIKYSARSLKGVGIRDGIHGEMLPAHWKAGLAAWSHRRYGDAAKIFSSVANREDLSGWHRSAGHYWAHRAYSRAGDNRNASVHLQRAAEYPLTLYGVLASQQLGKDKTIAQDLPKLDAVTLAIPAIRRAAMYNVMDRREDAEQEIRTLYTNLSKSRRPQLVTVAARLGLPALQLRIAQADDTLTADDSGAYPIPQWVSSQDMIADPALVYAIARQESGFYERARNPNSGATGIMQIMPSTASYMIRQYKLDEIELASLDLSGLGKKAITVSELDNTDVNLTVGQHYINYLLEKPFVKGNIIHLLASYNAGPANLISWQKQFEDVEDPLLFIELIPFRETRHYVKQVLTNYLIYNQLIHEDNSMAMALSQNKWPVVDSQATVMNGSVIETESNSTMQ